MWRGTTVQREEDHCYTRCSARCTVGASLCRRGSRPARCRWSAPRETLSSHERLTLCLPALLLLAERIIGSPGCAYVTLPPAAGGWWDRFRAAGPACRRWPALPARRALSGRRPTGTWWVCPDGALRSPAGRTIRP